jgi:uncharacterized integral membrane protein
MKAKGIAGLIFLVLLVILLFQNQQVVTYRVFFWEISLSQVLLVPIVLLIGFFFGLLIRLNKKAKTKKTLEHEEDDTFEESK